MHKTYLRIAFILGAITVGLGAFGAHKLKELVSDDAVDVYQTAVFYQFIHLIALAITGIIYKDYPNKWLSIAGILFLLGILFFSGSLYIITYSKATVSPGFRWVGPITPIGGILFIAGWMCLAFGTRRKYQR